MQFTFTIEDSDIEKCRVDLEYWAAWSDTVSAAAMAQLDCIVEEFDIPTKYKELKFTDWWEYSDKVSVVPTNRVKDTYWPNPLYPVLTDRPPNKDRIHYDA